jgi:hypothetical protein
MFIPKAVKRHGWQQLLHTLRARGVSRTGGFSMRAPVSRHDLALALEEPNIDEPVDAEEMADP